MLDLILLGGSDNTVLERDIFCIINRHSFACAVETNAVEEQVVNRKTFQSGDVHRFLRIDTGDITEREIAPNGIELTLVIAIRCTATTGRTIGVAGLEEDRRWNCRRRSTV